jgi:ElaB/YqjD/DUF883 family membrane-anchored ribosome-binding protein
MTADTDRIVQDLHKLVAELETVTVHAKDAGERMSGRLDEAAAGLRRVLTAAQGRVGYVQARLQRRIGRAARAANETVRENPWGAVAIGAAAALLLGFALAHGSASPERASTSDDSTSDGSERAH